MFFLPFPAFLLIHIGLNASLLPNFPATLTSAWIHDILGQDMVSGKTKKNKKRNKETKEKKLFIYSFFIRCVLFQNSNSATLVVGF
jgi:hypothetical protein